MRMEIADYEIKRGKYISFRAKGKERFARGKTLGPRYTEDAIKDRIEHRTRAPKPQRQSINLLIDIQNNIKAQESKGYEHWAKLYNLKQASRTLNFLTEHNIGTHVYTCVITIIYIPNEYIIITLLQTISYLIRAELYC